MCRFITRKLSLKILSDAQKPVTQSWIWTIALISHLLAGLVISSGNVIPAGAVCAPSGRWTGDKAKCQTYWSYIWCSQTWQECSPRNTNDVQSSTFSFLCKPAYTISFVSWKQNLNRGAILNSGLRISFQNLGGKKKQHSVDSMKNNRKFPNCCSIHCASWAQENICYLLQLIMQIWINMWIPIPTFYPL